MSQKILNRLVIAALILSSASLIFQFGRSVGSMKLLNWCITFVK